MPICATTKQILTRKQLPDDVKLDTSVGDTLDDDPRDGQDRTDDSDTDDRPPWSLCWPSLASDDGDDETSEEDDTIPPFRNVLVSFHQSGVSIIKSVECVSSFDGVDDQSPECLFQRSPEFDEHVKDRKGIVHKVGSGDVEIGDSVVRWTVFEVSVDVDSVVIP